MGNAEVLTAASVAGEISVAKGDAIGGTVGEFVSAADTVAVEKTDSVAEAGAVDASSGVSVEKDGLANRPHARIGRGSKSTSRFILFS